MADTFDRVRKIIVEHFQCDPSVVKPETRFFDHLGADNLDRLEVGLEIEMRFDFVFDDDDLSEFITVGDIVALIERKSAAAVPQAAE